MSIHYNYRGGGGNQSTSLPPADDDLESIKSDDLESIKSDDSVESPSVLLITTHGGYPSKKLKQFTSPTNIKKINAKQVAARTVIDDFDTSLLKQRQAELCRTAGLPDNILNS